MATQHIKIIVVTVTIFVDLQNDPCSLLGNWWRNLGREKTIAQNTAPDPENIVVEGGGPPILEVNRSYMLGSFTNSSSHNMHACKSVWQIISGIECHIEWPTVCWTRNMVLPDGVRRKMLAPMRGKQFSFRRHFCPSQGAWFVFSFPLFWYVKRRFLMCWRPINVADGVLQRTSGPSLFSGQFGS